jgi:hypothetical protein
MPTQLTPVSFSPTQPGPFSGLRVVHAANYQFAKDGLVFFNPDQKLHQGLVQNGCYVYPFSINDRARMLSPTGSKTFGKGRANKALIETCVNVHPDILMLGHAQYIQKETLQEIRNRVPDIRIGLWYFDAMWVPKNIEHIHHRNEVLDAVFATTGGELLRSVSTPDCPAAFIPNPVDPSIERLRTFENSNPDYDVVFFGCDKRAPERKQILQDLIRALPDARLGIFGSLGNPYAFGHEKERILASSRMALNLNRRNDVELYSSDRIAQLTGNGLVTLTPAGAGLESLYSSDEVVYFDSVDDLARKVHHLMSHDDEAVALAKAGWKRTHEVYSVASVAAFILGLTMRDESYRLADWSRHVYWGPEPAATKLAG